ncbi:MAG: PilZ domain-containing protein [bacterium]|nr:PilZ domain-containing protein [bacterium]
MGERRQNPRVSPSEETFGRIRATIQARILDVSTGGLQVELGAALHPSVECEVSLPIDSGEIRLRAMVRRCRAAAIQGDGGERGGMMFRAGLEFIGMSEDQARLLAESYCIEPTAMDEMKTEPIAVTPSPEPPPSEPKRPRRKGPIKIRINPEFIKERIKDK